jgi:ATP-dependent 26S proteasome regulatory subunit
MSMEAMAWYQIEGPIITWVPIIFMGLLVFLIWRTMKMMPRTKPQQIKPESAGSIGWDDIAGADEAKHELQEVVEFLRDPARFTKVGANVPKGIMLHGPPGTGKTLTAMYLAAQMPGRTAVLLTGQSLGAVGASIDLATALQPAMVVLEDVDLVAMDRDYDETNPILFELLNGMDGLDEDHDVLFVLTTNRADLLEPALATRPGRIDQAVELPLPDADGRRRLLELYGEGLELTLTGDEPLIATLDGVSPAFIRELLRRAALMVAEESEGALIVRAEDLERAFEELRHGAGTLTNALLGANPDELDDDEE